MNSYAKNQPELHLDGTKIAIWVGVFVALAITLYPFVPMMQYALGDTERIATLGTFESTAVVLSTKNYVLIGSTQEQHLGLEGRVAGTDNFEAWSLAGAISHTGSREAKLLIPKIGVDIPIAVTDSESEGLDRGAWLMPGTSTPSKGGNTAFAAHRWRYVPPSSKTFYLLDKLTAGDEVQIIWNGKEYHYRVTDSEIVPPTATEVLNDRGKPTITLITCDPIFSTTNRLVVSAELIDVR